MYKIIVNNRVVHRTKKWDEALKVTKEVFKKGYEDVILSGGKIGYWR